MLRLSEWRDQAATLAYRALDRSGLLRQPAGQAAYLTAYDFYKQWTDRAPLALARRVVKAGDTVVDVGANVGFYTVRLAEMVGPGGTVHAFEPNRWAANVVRSRLLQGNITNVLVHELALAEAGGQSDLYLGQFPSDARLYAHADAAGSLRVGTAALDDILASWSAVPTLIKMDVQGGEVGVLRGMRRVLEADHPLTLVLELWPWGLRAAGSGPMEVFDLTARGGLRAARIGPTGLVFSTSAEELLADCGPRGYVDVAFVR